MKNLTNSIKYIGVILLTILISGSSVLASTYTAVVSGGWTSSTTWGGSVPPLNISADQVTIPVGVDVTLDNNLSINGALASLDIEGSLTDNLTDTMYLGSGALTGLGGITVNSITLGVGSSLAFTGHFTVQTLLDSSTIAMASVAIVNQTLYLMGGTLSLQSGGGFIIGSNANIILAGGNLINTAGVLTLTNTYNVTYTNSSTTTGAELSGAGLNNVIINVPAADSVILSGNIALIGTLGLTSGVLVLNSHNLNIYGDLASSGSGSISSTGNSNIFVQTNSSLSGGLTFTSGASTVNNFTQHVDGAGHMINISSDLTVNGILQINSGNKLNMQSNGLHIGPSGSISSGDDSTYIIATGGGYVSIPMMAGSGWTVFPVGTSAHYSPVAAQMNTGSAGGAVNVSVADNVYSHGATGVGTNFSLTEPSVDMTYFVEPDSATNTNLNLQLMWSQNMEVNSFVRDSAYISHYTNASWDASVVGTAGTQGGLYMMERDNISTFSPFAVFGKGANTAATGIVNLSTNNISVYPNPASDHILIENISDPMTIDIIDITGQKVGSYIVSAINNTISVASLTPGNYMIKLSDSRMTTTKQFIKM